MYDVYMFLSRRFEVLQEERDDRKKRSIWNFFLLLFLLLLPLKIDGQLKMFRSQFSLQITGGGKDGGRETETRRGRDNGKRASVPRFAADKRNDRCRAVIGKQ